MGHVYPELRDNLPFIRTVLETEEERFAEAIESGSRLLDRLMGARPAIVDMVSALRAGASPGDSADLHEAESSAKALLLNHSPGEAAEIAGLLERVFAAAVEVNDATPASVGTVWDDFLAADWKISITGYEAAYLYDTYGFPIDVTQEMALENEFSVDLDGFEREMDLQRERGRASARFGGDAAGQRIYQEFDFDETLFLGYEVETATKADSVVRAIIRDGAVVDEASEGDEIEIILRETPFFAERGGQMGDAGFIKGEDGVVEVADTQNPYARINVHFGRVGEGSIKVGDGVSAEVDAIRREKIRRNHTGTHLIHAALRQVLGSHVRQSGSLVAPDRLRFDFTHIAAMTRDEILEVQRVVNDRIRANHEVEVEYTTYQDAVANGALAFFGDKYDETNVRTIKIDPPWSYELCGGTHCDRSGDIGSFLILTEGSIGSGMRRIEAFTGVGAEDLVTERLYSLDQISADLQTPVGDLHERVNSMRSEADASRRRISELEAAVLRASVGGGVDAAEAAETVEVDGSSVALHVKRVDAPNIDALRKTGDFLRDRLDSGVVVIGSEIDERPMVIAMVTKDLVARGFHAGDIVKQVARVMGGGGGGRPDSAQAGGRDAAKLDEALASVKEIIQAGQAGPSSS
jgi:alanyl-tRNA synthetase